jgi:hypothetical protein
MAAAIFAPCGPQLQKSEDEPAARTPTFQPIAQWNDTLVAGFASGCAPNINGREQAPSGTPTNSCTTSLDWFVLTDAPSAFRGQDRETFSESWMREKRLSSCVSSEGWHVQQEINLPGQESEAP